MNAFPSRNALFDYYLTRMPGSHNAEILDVAFAGFEPERAASVQLLRLEISDEEGESVWFYGTLGLFTQRTDLGHQHQFIGIYDIATRELVELVASAKHYDALVERLDYGHTFPLGTNSKLRERGYTSAIVLDSQIYPPFSNLSQSAPSPTALFSITPLTASEQSLKSSKGLDALLVHWEKSERVIFHINNLQI